MIRVSIFGSWFKETVSESSVSSVRKSAIQYSIGAVETKEKFVDEQLSFDAARNLSVKKEKKREEMPPPGLD